MGRKIFGLIMLAIVTNSPSSLKAGSWEHDYSIASSKAKQLQVPLLIHFHADWCGPCQNMERTVLNSPRVLSSLGSQIIGVKVNSDLHRNLVSQFGVSALPTDVFVSPDGRIQKFSQGSRSLGQYVQLLQQEGSKIQQTNSAATDVAEKGLIRQASSASASTSPQQDGSPDSPAPKSPRSAPASVTQQGQQPEVTLDNSGENIEGHRTENETENRDEDSSTDMQDSVILSLDLLAGDRVGLDGFCPVSLCQEKRWVRGQPELEFVSDGVRYRFRSQTERDLFLADPDRYTPKLHGCDPIELHNHRRIVSGQLQLGATFRNQVYFFSSEEHRRQFIDNPSQFSIEARFAFFNESQTQEIEI